MDATLVTGHNYGYTWAFGGFLCFVCSNFLLGFVVPNNARGSQHHTWKWKNIATSFLHSSISGGWAALCFWQTPELRDDLVNVYTVSAHRMTALSVGYFCYDFLDMAIYDRKRSRDLLLHHFLSVLCLGLSLSTRLYLGFSCAALLIEVNSVFLHLRQLMIMQGVSKRSTIYFISAALNLGTFFVFRLVTLTGMIHWLWTHRAEVTSTAFFLGSLSMPVLMVMNIQLLLRVLKSDYGHRSSAASVPDTSSPSKSSSSRFNAENGSLISSVPTTDMKHVMKNGGFNFKAE